VTFPISRQGLQDIALFLIAGALIFVVLALVTRYRGGDWRRFAMSAGVLGVLVVVSYALAFTIAPNIPTPPVPFTARFAQNPTPDTPETIDAGRAVFQANCAICHGPRGLGDGPQAFL
jgi:mono/diheme cytochrome c family protein